MNRRKKTSDSPPQHHHQQSQHQHQPQQQLIPYEYYPIGIPYQPPNPVYFYPYPHMIQHYLPSPQLQHQLHSVAYYQHYHYHNNTIPSSSNHATNTEISSPRGPPKKPIQSGHAVWVGNLPPSTTLEELLKLFGNMDIESVFLIEKTSCAFVNYGSEKAVDEIVSKMNSFKFKKNHLVVKKQRSAAISEDDRQPTSEKYEIPQIDPKNRYFICKSLTLEDIKASARLGIWSTQPHNEHRFNEAFNSAENVYLFFSANRTREFYGYARMESAVESIKTSTSSAASASPPTPTPPPTSSSGQPKIISTSADSSIPIPAGRIIDDRARGSLFWEVLKKPVTSCSFKIKWLSKQPLSFSRISQLRNRFNGNQPVKIARDGTEIEPLVGEKLIELFV